MPNNPTVTQKEIAQRAGVTPVLVSRALSGHPSVAKATRERIESLARELGYNAGSNLDARSLIAKRYGKRVRTDIIAVLMPASFFGMALPRIPFFAPLIEGIEQSAAERGLDIHLCSPRDGRLPRLVERGGVDGIVSIVWSFPELEALDLPVVGFGEPGGWMPALMPDNRRGALLSVRHLVELGHKRIACLAFSVSHFPGHRFEVAADRIEGYKEGLIEAGLPVDENLIGGHVVHPTVEAGIIGMERMLESGPADFTGLVCYNDLIAMGAIEVLRRHGRCVPEDVSVVGFDDVSEQYRFDPPLTSVHFDRFAMGCRAVELICQRREQGQQSTRNQNDEIFPVEVKIRSSTGAPPNH